VALLKRARALLDSEQINALLHAGADSSVST
jgi:hypothetical protein